MSPMPKRSPNIPAVLAPSPVLITESVEEFNRLHGALKDELQINGTLEHLMLNGIGELGWGIRRYRRLTLAAPEVFERSEKSLRGSINKARSHLGKQSLQRAARGSEGRPLKATDNVTSFQSDNVTLKQSERRAP